MGFDQTMMERWVTTEKGHHVHLNDRGEADVGNRHVVEKMNSEPGNIAPYPQIKKSEFEIRGKKTGSRLAGKENEYVYKVYYNGKPLGKDGVDYTFNSKSNASQWIGKAVNKMNELRESANVKNGFPPFKKKTAKS